jgi:putative membrane protein
MLTAEEHELLRQAIANAEARSAGEIYVVVDDVADEFRLVPVFWAAVAALVVPWLGYFATTWSIATLLLTQGVAFVALSGLLSLPALRHVIVPAAMADEAAFRNARAVFLAHGVHLTAARTGVLIYLSKAPRR